jgi:uncharacterized membrane protein
MVEQGRPVVPRWRRFALPASIVLNLFLAAVIGGHVLSVRRAEVAAGAGGPLARALASAEASLPPPDAAAFGATLRRDAPAYMDSARQLGAARVRLGREILAEPFDPVRVQQALAAWQAAWNRFVDDFSKPLVEALGQVSPEGRRKLLTERRSGRLTALAP